MYNEAAYWISLSRLPKWGHQKINNLIIKFYHEDKITIIDFFELSELEWKLKYKLDNKEVSDLIQAKSEITNNAFLAESLINQGFEIIPITSAEYSKTLKRNLKTAHSPAVLYIKGNKNLLHQNSIAIVGSRSAAQVSLDFTDNISKQAVSAQKVVVSGFAKGVDKQALDSALKYGGKSIIVLPQGILTFTSGFKNYYQQIVNGDVLILSIFFPKVPWKAELAMARNPIIYGLADEIFVAESSEKGGTWSGVMDGLRKGRKIFVRAPQDSEINANNILIQKGAVPVDLYGCEISTPIENWIVMPDSIPAVQETTTDIKENIIKLLKDNSLTAKEIKAKLNIPWTAKKLNTFLKSIDSIEVFKLKRSNCYKLKGLDNEPVLF